MATTYEPIATYTLPSAQASIDFTGIPSTYTDLRIVYVCTQDVTSSPRLRLNSDTAANYSQTSLYGQGISAASGRETNVTLIYLLQNGAASTTIPTMYTIDFLNYSNTTTNKTSLIRSNTDQNGSGNVQANVALYRSTSAISAIKIFSSGNISAGSTATLYGIKAA